MSQASVAVDVGGTFTDIVFFERDTGRMEIAKVPSTPKCPEKAVANGVSTILEKTATLPEQISFFGHGTTVATNTIIEKKGAKVGMITTEGFRDVIEMGRQKRPSVYDYNLDAFTPIFMIPRRRRLGVNERINFEGQIQNPLDLDRISEILNDFSRRDVESLAVCFLFSFINPVHETCVQEIVQKKCPDMPISLSSMVLPEFREYERFCATVFNAYVNPIIKRYIGRLEKEIKLIGLGTDVKIMQSNGGIVNAEIAKSRSILTFLSGPAAGVMGAAFLGNATGYKNMITLDIGGTSSDVSLIKEGLPTYSTDNEIDGYPLKLQMIDINTVGAGGGSVAWIDPGGALKSGPLSSGADPGPACYGKGGQAATNTDANVVLGYLGQDSFIGGKMKISRQLAHDAIKSNISDPLKMNVLTAANGVFKITTANMIGAIRKVSVLRGYDPRDYWLFAFGGSGPVYACKLAADLNMKGVIVPAYPGVQSAFGILTVDSQLDFVRTFKQPIDGCDLDTINNIYNEMEKEALAIIKSEKIEGTVAINRSADMRYIGQAYEVNAPVRSGEICFSDLSVISSTFHQKHKDLYKHSSEDEPVEFINYRISAFIRTEKPKMSQLKKTQKNLLTMQDALKENRQAFFEEMDGLTETPVYDRERLPLNSEIKGPAIIEQLDATTVVYPEQVAEIDTYGNIIITKINAGGGG